MQYIVPSPAQPPRTRAVVVTSPSEIEAIKRGELCDPIGWPHGGQWYATAQSLAYFREASAPLAAAA